MGLSGLPAAGAKALIVTTEDPLRDIMLGDSAVLVPVDSIDIAAFSVAQTRRGFSEFSIDLSDLSRRGVEDRLFAYGSHTVRMYGASTIFEDYRALQLLLALVDDETTPRAIAFLASPEGVVEVPVEAYVDEATGAIGWRLGTAIDGPVMHQFVTTSMYGCESFDDCDPVVAPVRAFDMAPNDLADSAFVVSPDVWWTEMFPEDDGSVPRAPMVEGPDVVAL